MSRHFHVYSKAASVPDLKDLAHYNSSTWHVQFQNFKVFSQHKSMISHQHSCETGKYLHKWGNPDPIQNIFIEWPSYIWACYTTCLLEDSFQMRHNFKSLNYSSVVDDQTANQKGCFNHFRVFQPFWKEEAGFIYQRTWNTAHKCLTYRKKPLHTEKLLTKYGLFLIYTDQTPYRQVMIELDRGTNRN